MKGVSSSYSLFALIFEVMSSNTIPPNSGKLLHNWRVMEAVSSTGIRTRHVCGQNAVGNMGISTSAIEEFDQSAMTVKTRSGKIYTLIGRAGESHLGSAAWKKWCRDNSIFAEVDVTRDYAGTAPETTITFKRLGILATS